MPKATPKDEGMSWLNPYLVLKNPKKALLFYEKAFGFKTKYTMPDSRGKIMHAEMAYRDCMIMMGPENPKQNFLSAKSMGGSPVGFYIYVDSVDSFFAKAKAAKARVKQKPTIQFYGHKTCTFLCPEGYLWTFAQRVADFDPSKAPA